jgi:hypothetical protein
MTIPRQFNGTSWTISEHGIYELWYRRFHAVVENRNGWFQWKITEPQIFADEEVRISDSMALTLAQAQFAVETNLNVICKAYDD